MSFKNIFSVVLFADLVVFLTNISFLFTTSTVAATLKKTLFTKLLARVVLYLAWSHALPTIPRFGLRCAVAVLEHFLFSFSKPFETNL